MKHKRRHENHEKKYKRRIFINPNIHFGKPCITETRIPIENILELVQEGISFKEIIDKYYPDLEIEDIKACVQYAVDIIRSEEIHAEVA